MQYQALAFIALSLMWISCGGSTKADGTGDTIEEEVEEVVDVEPEVEPDVVDVTVDDVEEEEAVTVEPCPEGYVPSEGQNYGFDVLDEERTFVLALPEGVSTGYGPWPVIFVWHDYETGPNQMAENTDVDTLVGELDFPYIAVLPAQMSRGLPESLGWQMLQVEDADTNPDVVLFDCLLASINAEYGIDPDRVYSVGFSTGAIMSNLLSFVRNDVIASTVSYSGSFYTDPAQEKCLGTECTFWPDVVPAYDFPTIVLEGGDWDYFDIVSLLTLDFHADGLATLGYLAGLGHEVIYCPHAEGHVIPSDFKAAQFVRFFRDHPRGTRPSPYATDIPTIFPSACEYRAP